MNYHHLHPLLQIELSSSSSSYGPAGRSPDRGHFCTRAHLAASLCKISIFIPRHSRDMQHGVQPCAPGHRPRDQGRSPREIGHLLLLFCWPLAVGWNERELDNHLCLICPKCVSSLQTHQLTRKTNNTNQQHKLRFLSAILSPRGNHHLTVGQSAVHWPVRLTIPATHGQTLSRC